jgi:hypothetical protein
MLRNQLIYMHGNVPDDGGRPKHLGIWASPFNSLIVNFMNSPVTQVSVLCLRINNNERYIAKERKRSYCNLIWSISSTFAGANSLTRLVGVTLEIRNRYPPMKIKGVFLEPPGLEQVKWSRYSPDVAQMLGKGITLLFHNRGTRTGWVVSSTPRPHLTPGKDPVSIL